MVDLGGTFKTADHIGKERKTPAKISIFTRPVTNTKNQKKYGWPGLYDLLTGEPEAIPNNTSDIKAEYGNYYVRGDINGNRDDDHLGDCCLLIMDIDKPVDGLPLPTPEESHQALKGTTHAVHSSATPGRSRIIFPVEIYQKEDTEKLTKAAYVFCRSRGLNFGYAGESETKSQPWFLPQTTDFEAHQAYGQVNGTMFDSSTVDTSEYEEQKENPADPFPDTSDHNPMRDFIAELKSGTIHQAAKTFAGWRAKTTDLSVGQVFDEIDALVESNCSDSEKVKRWFAGERDKLEKWFQKEVADKKDAGEQEESEPDVEKKSIDDILGGFEVKREYVDSLGNEEFLVDNLIIKQHIITIIAMSGAGKTTYIFNHAAPQMAKKGLKVRYIDADSPASDHKRMKATADKYGFMFLNPDVNQGTSSEMLMKYLRGIADIQSDLTDNVFIFDTLKKFADMMSKGSVKEFYKLARKLTTLKATIILLGHANKYRDKDGNLIFEGVNDVKSDSDELIFFEATPGGIDGIDVTTVVDTSKGAKVRGLFEPFSFNISTSREITFHKNPLDLADNSATSSPKATDLEILETAKKYLAERDEPVGQSPLVQHVVDMTKAGKNRVRGLIVRNSSQKDKPNSDDKMFAYTVGERNTHKYELFYITEI